MTNSSQKDEIEVINILKWYSDKKTERVIKYLSFLVSTICLKQNIKHMEMDRYFIITFPLRRHLAFWKDLFFVFVSFWLLYAYL